VFLSGRLRIPLSAARFTLFLRPLSKRARRESPPCAPPGFGRARGWRQACRPGTKVLRVAWAAFPQEAAKNDSPPSSLGRRAASCGRASLCIRHAPRIGSSAGIRTKDSLSNARSRFQVNRRPRSRTFRTRSGHWVKCTPDVRRTYLPRSPGVLNSGSRGKAPRALNLARGVSDELREAFSRVGAWLVDPHSRPPTLFRLAAARTRRQLRAQHLVASCQPIPSFRLAS
jgi:hypothetical protein